MLTITITITITNAASEAIHTTLRVPACRRKAASAFNTPGIIGDCAFSWCGIYVVAAEVAERFRDKTVDARRNDTGRTQFVLHRRER